MDRTNTVKGKPARQAQTTLNEFEQNVKTLAGILEAGINTIDKWIEDLNKRNEHNLRFLPTRTTDTVISMLESFYPFGDLFPEIKRFLTHHIPNFTDKVESRYSNIQKKIQEIVAKCSHNPCNPPTHPAIPYSEMYELKRDIELLVGDLRYCVKEAKGTESGKAGGGKNGGQSIDSQNKQEDIIELKPTFYGISLNINALIRKIRKIKWGIKIKNLLKAFIRILLHK